jgi:ZIP family zinc transporter
VKVALAVGAVAVLVGAGALVVRETRGGSSGEAEEVTVAEARLQPGRIVLTLDSRSDRVVSIAQAIVNDAYVNFAAGSPGSAEIAIDYPWIEGESYEIELLTSTGGSVDFELEDAEAT